MKYILILCLTFTLYAQNILGRVDKFDIPDLNIYCISAKIDTGARTSSLGCKTITPLDKNMVKFNVLTKDGVSDYIIKPISRVSKVKSSNGEVQNRYFIKTKILIYDKLYDIELSLSFRDKMKYPLLIGRELLSKGFIVDTRKKNLSCELKNNPYSSSSSLGFEVLAEPCFNFIS